MEQTTYTSHKIARTHSTYIRQRIDHTIVILGLDKLNNNALFRLVGNLNLLLICLLSLLSVVKFSVRKCDETSRNLSLNMSL